MQRARAAVDRNRVKRSKFPRKQTLEFRQPWTKRERGRIEDIEHGLAVKI